MIEKEKKKPWLKQALFSKKLQNLHFLRKSAVFDPSAARARGPEDP